MTGIDIGPIDDIPVGEGRTFSIEGEQIAVFRLRNGVLRAVDAVCPHMGGPLADGLADESVVVCPLHGHTFDLTTGCESGGREMSVRSYPVEAIDGTVRVSVRPV